MRHGIADFLPSVHHEVGRRAQSPCKLLLDQALLGRRPVGGFVGQLLLVDYDQQVEVGDVALGGMRLVNPATACMTAVQDDLEDASALAP